VQLQTRNPSGQREASSAVHDHGLAVTARREAFVSPNEDVHTHLANIRAADAFGPVDGARLASSRCKRGSRSRSMLDKKPSASRAWIPPDADLDELARAARSDGRRHVERHLALARRVDRPPAELLAGHVVDPRDE